MNTYTIGVLCGLAAFAAVALYGAIRSAAANRGAGPGAAHRLGLGQDLADCATCRRTTVHQLHRADAPTCLTCMTTPGSDQ